MWKFGCKAEANQRSQKETICTAATAANTVQLYGDDPEPAAQPQLQQQQLLQQFPTLMDHQPSSSSSCLQDYNYTMSGDGSTFTSLLI